MPVAFSYSRHSSPKWLYATFAPARFGAAADTTHHHARQRCGDSTSHIFLSALALTFWGARYGRVSPRREENESETQRDARFRFEVQPSLTSRCSEPLRTSRPLLPAD